MKVLYVCLGILICLYIPGCSFMGGENETKTDTLKLPVTSLIRIDTVFHTDYIADIHAIQNIEIRSRVKGFLDAIYVDEGQLVKKGELLFKISDLEYKAELVKANANLKAAIAELKTVEVELQRVKLLVENKVVTKTELEMNEAKRDAAKAKIEEAESNRSNAEYKLSYTLITAPFEGCIDRFALKAGSLVDEGALLTSLSDNQQVFAYFNVSEREYLDLVPNMNDHLANNDVELVLANNGKHLHKGKIETIDGEFDKNTGNIAFRAKFPNPAKVLKHGSSGKVRLSKGLHNALIVPQKATFEIQDRIYVYVVDKNNRVKAKSFIPAMRFPHFYVVETGLGADEKIVYEGIQRIHEDSEIIPEFFPMKTIL